MELVFVGIVVAVAVVLLTVQLRRKISGDACSCGDGGCTCGDCAGNCHSETKPPELAKRDAVEQ